MSLSFAELDALVRDLAPRLEGGRVERIDQPEVHKLVLTVRNGPALYWLLICVHPRFSRLHLLTRRPERSKPAAGFCNVVRQHLTGAAIAAVRQVPRDRIVLVECLARDRLLAEHEVTLVAEMIGVGSNLMLVAEDARLLGMLFRERSRRRTLAPGQPYEALPTPEGLPERASVNRFAHAVGSDDPLALSRAIAMSYSRLETSATLEERRADLLGRLRSVRRSARKRDQRLERELAQADAAESLRRKGELLKLVLPDLRKGQREAVVEDLFEPSRPAVTIELDPTLSPEQNVSRLFKRYKKAKAGRETMARRLDATRRELEMLDSLLEQAEEAADLGTVEAVDEQARRAGVRPEPAQAAAQTVDRAGPRLFHSAEGFEILVARNARENDRLTFRIGRGNDHWLHILGWRGPHVIVRTPREREVTQEALLDAAHLAVHFSKIRGADRADVTHTQCKYVRRLKGAPAGTVSYAQASTIRLRVEPDRLERLLGHVDNGAPPPDA